MKALVHPDALFMGGRRGQPHMSTRPHHDAPQVTHHPCSLLTEAPPPSRKATNTDHHRIGPRMVGMIGQVTPASGFRQLKPRTNGAERCISQPTSWRDPRRTVKGSAPLVWVVENPSGCGFGRERSASKTAVGAGKPRGELENAESWEMCEHGKPLPSPQPR